VKEYRQAESVAKKSGMTFSELMESSRKKSKVDDDDDDVADDGKDKAVTLANEEELKGIQLKRHQFTFANWSANLFNLAMHFIDRQTMTLAILKSLTKNAKKEMFETGLRLRMFGEELDRVGTQNFFELCELLKKVYEDEGCPWRNLSINTETGELSYEHAAPWMLVSQETADGKVEVKAFLSGWANYGEEVPVTVNETYLFDDVGPFHLTSPYSVRTGGLLSESSGEVYNLWNLLPPRKRKLQRRPSDQNGASNLARKSFAQVKQELADKRGQAAKTKGITSLSKKTTVATKVTSTSGGASASNAKAPSVAVATASPVTKAKGKAKDGKGSKTTNEDAGDESPPPSPK